MRLKDVCHLVIAAPLAMALTSPAVSAQRLSGPGDKERCKEEKARLHHQERILKDRRRLALDECRASSHGGPSRCEELKRQHKAELKQLKDRHKLASKDRKEDVKGDRHERKEDRKTDKREGKPDHKEKKHPLG